MNLNYNHKIEDISFTHSISVKNLLDKDYYIPEYVRRKVINEIPFGIGRTINYSLKLLF